MRGISGRHKDVADAERVRRAITGVLQHRGPDRVRRRNRSCGGERQVGGEFIGRPDGPHLNRTQGHALAARLGTADEISRRLPPTDTGSPGETPEEIDCPLSYERKGLCVYRQNQNVSASDVGLATQLATGQLKRAFAAIDAKRKSMRHVNEPPSLVGVMTDFGG